MGKRTNKHWRTRKPGKAHAQQDDAYMDKEIDDEIDSFHKQQEMIPLDVNKDVGDSDDDMEEPVFDLEGYQNGGSFNDRNGANEGDDDEDDEDDENFDDVEDKGFAAKIARQAKYLKEKFGGGEDEMSDDEQDEEIRTVWGRKKNLYYSADNIDYELQSSDEDLPMEEEAEVLKIQRERAKTLEIEDFGLEDDDQEGNDLDDEEKAFQELGGVRVTRKPGAEAVDGISDIGFKEIKKDINALSKAEQMDVVYSSAPELVSLLSELNTAIDQLREVKALPCKVIREGEGQAKGMDYLELKQILLLIYCQAICFYLLLKSEGHPVRDHPVIARLVEIKNLLEKMKQISSKFPSQDGDVGNHIYESTNKSNEENISLELEPELADMPTKALQMAKMAGGNSKNAESKNANDELRDSQRDLKSIEMMKIKKDLEVKLKQKGIYSHIQRMLNKPSDDLVKPINENLVTMKDFDDEVKSAKQHDSEISYQSLNKFAQTIFTKAKGCKAVSGDDDLPKRDDIAERRRKHELKVLARAGVIPMDDGEDGYDNAGINSVHIDRQENQELESESEDEFYRKAKKQRAEKLNAKAEIYSRVHGNPLEEPEADGKRQITRQIEKNRGLTRNRKKLTKNPRKKYKIKHQKAVTRRKGQVRDIRKPSGPYGGESTGINTNVSRSIRFKT